LETSQETSDIIFRQHRRMYSSSFSLVRTAAVLSLLGTTATASTSSSCVEPILVGEIRNWKDKTQCIDPTGYDGMGDVNTYLCDGHADQTFKFCEDGTIRSEMSGYCLDVAGYDGLGNVQMWACEVYPTIKEDQQWDIVPVEGSFEDSGISQDLFLIKNRKSGKCLDISGYDGKGAVGIYSCDGFTDQHYYIRSRGKIIGSGKLQNQKSGQCLDVSGYDGIGNVATYKCEDEEDQMFTLYENGELVNKDSNYCVDISGYEGMGRIGMYPCEALPDQQWNQVLWDASRTYFTLASKKSNHCLDVSGYDGYGEVSTYHICEDLPDQRWKWIPTKWTTPEGSWNKIFCNMNGGIKQTITSSVTSSTSITKKTAFEIGVAIEGGVDFGFVSGKSTVSTSVSKSLSQQWSASNKSETSIEVSCDRNDDGSDFTGGCLWQWHLQTSSLTNNVKWRAGIAKCTPLMDTPKCPPFTKCVDEQCSSCEEY